MPFTFKTLTVDEAKAEFKRSGSNIENLGDYIDVVRGLGMGEAFTVSVRRIKSEETDDAGVVTTVYKDVIPDTEQDGEMDTVRAFKRRMNAAADSLKVNLKWKNKGHTEPDGETARFQLDWLTAKIVATKAEAVDEDEVPANGVAVAAK